jgi:hypothetical protein
MVKPQVAIWDLLRKRNYEEIEDLKYFHYTHGRHERVEEIEQWVLQYFDELEERKDLRGLK